MITINSNNSYEPRYQYKLHGYGSKTNGIPDIAILTPESLYYKFADTNIGDYSDSYYMIITNEGSQDLTISDISFFNQTDDFVLNIGYAGKGAGSIYCPDCPLLTECRLSSYSNEINGNIPANQNLFPGQSCYISVTFNPNHPGLRQSDVRVVSDDIDENIISAHYEGNGIKTYSESSSSSHSGSSRNRVPFDGITKNGKKSYPKADKFEPIGETSDEIRAGWAKHRTKLIKPEKEDLIKFQNQHLSEINKPKNKPIKQEKQKSIKKIISEEIIESKIEQLEETKKEETELCLNPNQNYNDISKHWAKKEIISATKSCLVHGRELGQKDIFDPNQEIKLKEAVKITVRAFIYKTTINPYKKYKQENLPIPKKSPFTGLSKKDWSAPYFQSLKDNDIHKLISSLNKTEINPDQKITRAEAFALTLNIHN